ncbi:MAG: hypothetical protein Kow0056_04020 [Coriobacteriia bacterium]
MTGGEDRDFMKSRDEIYRETAERYRAILDAEGEPSEDESSAGESSKEATPQALGWRTSRRTSKVGKTARRLRKRQERLEATKEAAAEVATTGGRLAWKVFRTIGSIVLGSALVVATLMLLALAINGIARWNALRQTQTDDGAAARSEGNLLVIAADEPSAEGFLAVKVDVEDGSAFGIAIPAAAFMEVPGQGFEKVGESFKDGPDVSASAVSNFLSVQFDKYVVVPPEAYQAAMTEQSLGGLLENILETNMEPQEIEDFAKVMDELPEDEVAIAPLPVRPISLGDETYFEPQLDKIADLLMTWWGVDMHAREDIVSVIVYNGSGVPGIAGTAAQELISQGFRVVETRNADSFDYEETLIIVYDADESEAQAVRDVLGVGKVVRDEASQEVADMIVVVGKDFGFGDQDG